jgi:hypothetical protein
LHFELVAFLRNVFLQDFRLGRLGEPEIHHFVEQFVDDNKIVPDGFFFELFKVFLQDGAEAV